MDQVMDIVKQCFPKGDKFQIVENSIVGGYHNYVDDINRLIVKYEEDGKQNKKSLILKIPKNGLSAPFFSELDFIAREPFVYNIIIPRINEYLDESLTPFYYTTINSKIIVLENLVELGYDGVNNSRKPFGMDQCFFILKALAHFHASSHKVLHTKPDLLEHKMFHYAPLMEFRHYVVNFWETILLELLARNNASSLVPKLKKAHIRLFEKNEDVTSKIHYSNFEFHVLNHGEFRKDNLMVKYGSNDAIDGVKFIDFQTCFWSTPVYDFMLFFLVSTEAEIIENHFETLQKWYLECLNEKLKKLNCTQTYGKQDFIEDIKRLSLHVIYLVYFTAVMICPSERNQLIEKIFMKKKEDAKNYIEPCLGDERFTSSVLSGLKLCDKLGLFELI